MSCTNYTVGELHKYVYIYTYIYIVYILWVPCCWICEYFAINMLCITIKRCLKILYAHYPFGKYYQCEKMCAQWMGVKGKNQSEIPLRRAYKAEWKQPNVNMCLAKANHQYTYLPSECTECSRRKIWIALYAPDYVCMCVCLWIFWRVCFLCMWRISQLFVQYWLGGGLLLILATLPLARQEKHGATLTKRLS